VKEYQDLKEEMDKLVGMINGKFSTAHWSPIRYIYGCIEQVRLNTEEVSDQQLKKDLR
jgi:trehalose 6-phosphate synthase/phosphatase